MGRAGKRSVGNGRSASNVRPSVHLLLPSAPPACFPLSLPLSHVSLRSLYETVHPILFPVSVRPSGPLQIAHHSRPPMMKWPARKGKGSGRARLRVSLSHTHTHGPLSLSLPALSSRTIAANPNVLRHLDHFKARRSSRFCNGCRRRRRPTRSALVCPITEGRGSALFAICPFDLHM